MKERSIKELLQLMLDNQHWFEGGLCRWASNLLYIKIITFTEYVLLFNYIRDNRPSMFSSFEAFKWSFKNFYWKPKAIAPRILWLKKHISKL
jgi:hypothetical protein